jgi:hypothetical protein
MRFEALLVLILGGCQFSVGITSVLLYPSGALLGLGVFLSLLGLALLWLGYSAYQDAS